MQIFNLRYIESSSSYSECGRVALLMRRTDSQQEYERERNECKKMFLRGARVSQVSRALSTTMKTLRRAIYHASSSRASCRVLSNGCDIRSNGVQCIAASEDACSTAMSLMRSVIFFHHTRVVMMRNAASGNNIPLTSLKTDTAKMCDFISSREYIVRAVYNSAWFMNSDARLLASRRKGPK